MKKLISAAAAFAAALALAAMPCAALEEGEYELPKTEEPELDIQTEGDFDYCILTNESDENVKAASLEAYHGTEKNLVIPDEIAGLPVVLLGNEAFGGNATLETVTLNKSLTALGTYSFAMCTALTEFIVPEENTSFEAVDGVLYTESKDVLLRYPVGKRPTTYEIPDTVTEIGNIAFGYCDSLTEIKFPSSLTKLGNLAFTDCTGLTEVTTPLQVTVIPDYCFYRCFNLETVHINNNVTKIGMAAFACTNLSSVTLPTALAEIGQAAFVSTPMTEVTVPSNVTDIGYSAFGWKLASDQSMVPLDSFTVKGVSGSAAEQYVTGGENGGHLVFEATNPAEESSKEAAEPAVTEPAPEPDDGLQTGRIIGIALCCMALATIVMIAILAGMRGNKPDASDSDAAEPEKKQEDTDDEAAE